MSDSRFFDLACYGFLLAIFIMGLGASCAGLKPILRTIDDVAQDLCLIFATENEDALGVSPGDFCEAKDHLQPFIDQVLAAKQTAGGMALDKSGSDGTE